LHKHGYYDHKDTGDGNGLPVYKWYTYDSILVASDTSKAKAAHEAYKHYLAPIQQITPQAPAPVDILRETNERIAALEDEHDHQLRRALRAESELADYKRRFEMENERANGQAGLITRMKAALEQIFEPDAVEIWLKHGQALQAPAPTEAPATVTLSEGDFPNHDADDFTKADLELFARQDNPEKFWYYQELGERQKAAIASRRKELGLGE
jgi:hypothetical protein